MKLEEFTVESLIGGLDTFINPTEIDDTASPDCLNVIPTGKGAVKTRLGRIARGGEITHGSSGQGYFTYINTSGATEELVVVNGVLKKKSDNSWTTITGATFSTTARVNSTQIGDRLYFADGVTALCYYNGTAIVTTGVSSAPLPSILITFNRRLYANDINNPDRVYFGGALTATGAADNTGNFISTTPAFGGYLGFGKGKVVTAFGKLGGSHLVIGLKDGLYRISPTADTGSSNALTHAEEMVSNSIGIASHATVDNIENDLGFLSWSDFYLLGEVANYSSIRTRSISNKVSTLIEGISNAMITKTAGIYSPSGQRYYLAYADGATYNNKVLIYDVFYKSWWKFDSWHPAAWVEFVDSDNTRYLNYVSDNPADSFCYSVNNSANDNNQAISWYWKSKVFDLKGFDILKKFKRWATLFGPVFGSISVSVYINGTPNTSSLTIGTPTTTTSGLGSRILGLFVLGQETNDTGEVVDNPNNDWRWKKLSRPNEGSQIQFKFEGSGIGQSGQIEKIKIYYGENPLKKDRTKRIS